MIECLKMHKENFDYCLGELIRESEEKDKEIERLKEQLNDEIDEELKQSEIMVKKQEEIERLNNIIKIMEKWLEDKDKNALQDDNYWEVLDKLKELRKIYE